MTTIKLRTSDQHLIVTNKVKIAKGDVNSVELRVYLDSAWNDFTYITAVVSNDALNIGKAEFMLVSNGGVAYYENVIPSAYLSKAGTLSISISGVSMNGTKKKTSTIVKMKVYESLVNSETTIEPELDLYMQFLAALNKELNPTTTYINSEINKKMAEIDAKFAEQQALINGEVLWENPNPSAGIGSNQSLTIPIDRRPYTRLHIEIISQGTLFQNCFCVHSNGEYSIAGSNGSSTRRLTVTDNQITVSELSGAGSANSTIPYRIIGYKY